MKKTVLYTLLLLGMVYSAQAQVSLTEKMDSIGNEVDSVMLRRQLNEKIGHLEDQMGSKKDSINNRLDSLQNKVAGSTSKATQKVDSISNIPEGLVDSANYKLKSVEGKVNRQVDKMEGELRGKVDEADAYLDNKTGRLEEKTTMVDGGADKLDEALEGAKAKIPDAGVVDGLEPKLDGMGNLNTDKLGGMEESLPEFDGVKENIGKIDGLKGAGADKVNGFKEMDEVQKVTDGLGEVKDVAGDVGKYKEEIGGIANGDLGNTEKISGKLEEKALELDDVKQLQHHTGDADLLKQKPDEYTQQLKKLQDKEHVKKEMMKKAAQLGTDHFAEHQDKLNAAMKKMGDYKKKVPSLQSMKDLPKKMSNAMKGKPLRERLVFGGTFQTYKDPNVQIDLTPQIGYKLSGRWTANLAGSYRVQFKEKHYTLTTNNEVFGIEVNSTFKVFKGFYVKAEAEALSAMVDKKFNSVPSNPKVKGEVREWVEGYFLGIGKSYNFAKGVKGNVQVMYNFAHSGKSPYANQVNMKFGFDFGLKKKRAQDKKD